MDGDDDNDAAIPHEELDRDADLSSTMTQNYVDVGDGWLPSRRASDS